jgi:hypothetical protein
MPKPNSPRSKLPSIQELIRHPKVQAVVDRINQTTLTKRASHYLEEMQSYLRRRTEQVPSFHQIAERFARHLLGEGDTGAPVINATGVVLGAELVEGPLAEVAVQEIVRLAGEYHFAPRQSLAGKRPSGESWAEQVDKLLQGCTGAESAWVASCTVSAQWLIQMALGDTCEVLLAGPAGIVDPATFGLAPIAPISARLAKEDRIVLVEGAGMLGGPGCGIVLGQRVLVDKLRHHAAAPTLAANSLTLAALGATLNLYHGEQLPVHQIPILQLLSAPLDNLRQRAERLAPLMQESDAIAEAMPLEADSPWCHRGPEELPASGTSLPPDVPSRSVDVSSLLAPTWSISLRPAVEGPEAASRLFQSLQSGQRPVLARLAGDRVMLDLRSVFPRWDQTLVTAVTDLDGRK